MEIIGFIGVLAAICLIILFSAKGLNILIGAPLATMVVLITNRMNVLEWMLSPETSYLASVGDFFVSMFALFILGTILSQYMQDSHATTSIARTVLKIVGRDKPFNALFALALIGLLISYGGINSVIVYFAIIPIAHSVFKELDINWRLICIPVFLGVASITMTMLPGTPSPTNVIPAEALGTSMTAGKLLGFGASITAFIYGVAYMKYRLDKSLANGESFYSYLEDTDQDLPDPDESDLDEEEVDDADIPPFFLSILPMLVLIAIIFMFSEVTNIVVIALLVAVLLCALVFRKYLNTSDKELLNEGAADAVMPTLAMGSTVAFGTVLIESTGFSFIVTFLNSVLANPVLRLTIVSIALGAITGSSSGTVGILVNTMAPEIIAEGVDPVVVHRISGVASSIFALLPHAGAYITFSSLTHLPQKSTYRDSFAIVGGCHFVGLLTMLVITFFFY